MLEIGAGNGMNFRHYPDTVGQVVAVEPEPYLRGLAETATRTAAVPVEVQAGVAEELAFADGEFDHAVACLMLCSVRRPASAIGELHRVIRPGGELRFFEHVRGGRPAKARVQGLADRSGVWPLLAGGCHCSRDTITAIEAAGFEVESRRPIDAGPAWGLTNPHVLGRARRR